VLSRFDTQWPRAIFEQSGRQRRPPASALSNFAREMAERTDRGDAGFADKEWIPVMAAIDAATRGMGGLAAWTPPEQPAR
jgi:hypothetical protein